MPDCFLYFLANALPVLHFLASLPLHFALPALHLPAVSLRELLFVKMMR